MKLNSAAKRIAFTGVFAALALLFNIFTFPNTPLGTISFVYVPCMLAGIFLGPLLGFTVGFTADFLGCLIRPMGPISMLVLLSSGCIGLIPGLIFKYVKGSAAVKTLLSGVIVLIVCTLGLGSAGNYLVTGFLQNKYFTYWDYLLIARLPKQPFILLINTLLTYGLYKVLQRLPFFAKLAQAKPSV